MPSVYTIAQRAVEEALFVGVAVTPRIGWLYTPHARGMQCSVMTCPSDEFMQVSAFAREYGQAMAMRNWKSLENWMYWFYKASQLNLDVRNLTSMKQYERIGQRIGMPDMFQWELPTFEVEAGERLIFRTVSAVEYIQMHQLPWNVLAAHIMNIVLYGFPVLPSFVWRLQMTHVIEAYVRSRLFQGCFDQSQLSAMNEDSNLLSSFIPYNLNVPDFTLKITPQLKALEAQTALMKASVVGVNEIPVLFALARSKMFQMYQHPALMEYLEYVRRCEEMEILPVGYKTYCKVVHPIRSSPSSQSFIQYAF